MLALYTVHSSKKAQGQQATRFTSGEATFLVYGWSPSQRVLNSKKTERASGFSYKGANPIPGCFILMTQLPLQSPYSNPHPNPNPNILIDDLVKTQTFHIRLVCEKLLYIMFFQTRKNKVSDLYG